MTRDALASICRDCERSTSMTCPLHPKLIIRSDSALGVNAAIASIAEPLTPEEANLVIMLERLAERWWTAPGMTSKAIFPDAEAFARAIVVAVNLANPLWRVAEAARRFAAVHNPECPALTPEPRALVICHCGYEGLRKALADMTRDAPTSICQDDCTSGCHATDCEHHGFPDLDTTRKLADEGLAGDGLREAAQAVADEWSHPDGPSHGEMKDRMYALRAALDKETPKQTFSLPSNTIKES